MLGWPMEYVGPVLNLMRLFVLHPHVAQVYSKQIVEEKQTEDVVSTLCRLLTTTEKPITAMLAVRVLCNLFRSATHAKGWGKRKGR